MANNKYLLHIFKDGLLNRIDEGTYETLYNGTLYAAMLRDFNGVGENLPFQQGAGRTDTDAYIYYSAGYGIMPHVTNPDTGTEYKLPQYTLDAIPLDKLDFSFEWVEPHTHAEITGLDDKVAGSIDKEKMVINIKPNRILAETEAASREVDVRISMKYHETIDGQLVSIEEDLYHRQAKQYYTPRFGDYTWSIRVYDNYQNVYFEQEDDVVKVAAKVIPWNITTLNYYVAANRKQVWKWDDGFEQDQGLSGQMPVSSVAVADNAGNQTVVKDSELVYHSFIKEENKGYGGNVSIKLSVQAKGEDYDDSDSHTFTLFHKGAEYGIQSVSYSVKTIPVTGGKVSSCLVTYKCNGVLHEDEAYYFTELDVKSRGTSYNDNDLNNLKSKVGDRDITISCTDSYGTFTYALTVEIYQEPNTRERISRNDHTMLVTMVGTDSISAKGGLVTYSYNAYHHEYWLYATTETSSDDTVYDTCKASVPNISGTRFSVDDSSVLEKQAGKDDALVIVHHEYMGTNVDQITRMATDTVWIYFYKCGEATASVSKKHEAKNYQYDYMLNPTFDLTYQGVALKPNGTDQSIKPTVSNVKQRYKHAYTSGAEEPNTPTWDIEHVDDVQWYDEYYSKDGETWCKKGASNESDYWQYTATDEGSTPANAKKYPVYVKIVSMNTNAGEDGYPSCTHSINVTQQANVGTALGDVTTGYTPTKSKETDSIISRDGENIYVYITRQHGHYVSWTSGCDNTWVQDTDEHVTAAGMVLYDIDGMGAETAIYKETPGGYEINIPAQEHDTPARNVDIWYYADATYNNQGSKWKYKQEKGKEWTIVPVLPVCDQYINLRNDYEQSITVFIRLYTSGADYAQGASPLFTSESVAIPAGEIKSVKYGKYNNCWIVAFWNDGSAKSKECAYSVYIQHTLSLAVTPANSGTLPFTSKKYDNNETAEFYVTAASGYRFGSWSGGDYTNKASNSITMDDDYSLTATMIRTWTYAVSAGTGGKLSDKATASGTYDDGTTIKAYAPKTTTGYTFANWVDENGTKVSTNNEYSFDIKANTTLQAIFTINSHTLTVSAGDNGTISQDSTSSGTYDYGTSITLYADPAEGYKFVNWGDSTLTNQLYTFTMPDNDVTLTATFAIKTFTLTVEKDNTSRWNTVSGGGTYNYNSEPTITATAYTGYRFSHWTGDTTKIANSYAASTTVNAMTSDVKVKANFISVYKLSLSASPKAGGTAYIKGTTDSSGYYANGEEETIKATPASDYYFKKWSDNVTTAERSITMGSQAKSLTANFVKKSIKLTLSCANCGATKGSEVEPTYTVTFDSDGGTPTDVTSSATVTISKASGSYGNLRDDGYVVATSDNTSKYLERTIVYLNATATYKVGDTTYTDTVTSFAVKQDKANS